MQHKPDILILPVDQPLKKGVTLHNRIAVDHRGAFAMQLIQALAQSGRFGDFIVDQAVAMAEYTFARFEEQDWIQEMPPISELRGDDSQKAGF
mgnify:CR=1 FL=1